MNHTLTCTEPGHFQYSEGAAMQVAPGQSLLRIRRIGVCGTDLHAFEGTQPYFQYPRILGHELAGELIGGDIPTGFHLGQAVTFIPYFHCGQCIACRSGRTNCCAQLQVFGVHIDGGMREQIAVPSWSLIAGDSLSFEELALIEPLAIGAHAVRRAQIQPGECALVIGAGPIGLGIIEFAHLAGTKVIALDVNPARLDFCSQHTQAALVLNARDPEVVEKIRNFTQGDMPTVVFDATGNLPAIQGAFAYMAHGARYILVGLQKRDISFSHPEFHKREGTLMSSRNATREDFENVLHAMRSKQISPLSFITHRVGFAEAAEQFPGWLKPEELVVKAMIEV